MAKLSSNYENGTRKPDWEELLILILVLSLLVVLGDVEVDVDVDAGAAESGTCTIVPWSPVRLAGMLRTVVGVANERHDDGVTVAFALAVMAVMLAGKRMPVQRASIDDPSPTAPGGARP